MAGTCSRVAGALFFDAILRLISKYYTPFSYIWVIIACLKEFCLTGHVDLRRYDD